MESLFTGRFWYNKINTKDKEWLPENSNTKGKFRKPFFFLQMRKLISDIGNLFYPQLCAGCSNILNANEDILCLACSFTLPVTDFHNHGNNEMEKIFQARINIQSGASYLYFKKGGIVQNILHRMKYEGIREAAIVLGRNYGKILKESERFNDIDVIIPVPLHKKKEKKRGFNQSEEFGRGLSESMGKPLQINNLVRITPSETQTRKSRFRRWENVADIFHVDTPAGIENKKVLLVDDVVTTGATLESCAIALMNKCPGIEIKIATIAFAT